MKLLTIDILDTTLIRKCGEPQIIFHLLAYLLFPEDRILRNVFLQWRMEEKQKNACIEEIYETSQLPAIIAEHYTQIQLINAEKEIEYQNLIVNPKMASLIGQKRKEGWTIKFLSDMYLSSEFFTSKLKDEGILNDGDEVIVSCEWQARKDDGTIYDKVRDRYHPEVWHHYGDNLHSDVKMARKKGVKSTLISLPFLPEEKAMYHTYDSLHYSWQAKYLAGLSRSARIKMADSSFARMAADYVVPILSPYVSYIAKDAEKRGIKTIHFLSRDGYIMHEMAKYLLPSGVSPRYTFISRKALTAAFMHVCSLDEFILLHRNPEIGKMTINQALIKYLGIGTADLKDLFGITFNLTNISDYDSWETLAKSIFQSKTLVEYIKKNTLHQYNATLAYLMKQEIFEKGTAVADIGWLGHTRMMLNAIARSCGKDMPISYYFCVNNNAISSNYGEYVAYHTENKYLIIDHTPMIESYICASPHPSTSHYDTDALGQPYPVMEEKSDINNSPICEANIKAAHMILKEIFDTKQICNIKQEVLDTWGLVSLNALLEYRHHLDYKVFTHAEGITRNTLVHKFSLKDFPFLMIKSDFKFADYAVTFGYRSAKFLWNLREYAIKGIGFVYSLTKSI